MVLVEAGSVSAATIVIPHYGDPRPTLSLVNAILAGGGAVYED